MEQRAQIANRKLFELRQKLSSLRSEFGEWQRQSRAGGPLEKHHTQIRRVTDQLRSLEQVIGSRLDAVADDSAGVLAVAPEVERMMLELHRVWDFFRGKFALRSVEWFSPYLAAMDEFAWACYDTAREKLRPGGLRIEQVKEPPLVFFSGSVSPFTLPRDSIYDAEHVEGEKISTAEFRDVLRCLPIPVIGIPWLQVRHLPDALSIAHEVGHDVEGDFGIIRTLEYSLERGMNLPSPAVDERRQGAWRAWLGEIFADIFGCLAVGPAYARALADFLALSEDDIASEAREGPDWGDYPTRHLRVQLNVEVLSQLDFEAEAAALKECWLTIYPRHEMFEFEADVQRVVRSILFEPYPEFGGITLPQVITFTRHQHGRATIDAARMLERYAPETDDIRTLFASARLAFELKPEGYVAAEVQERVLRRVPQIQQPGYRRPDDKAAALRQRIEEYDKGVGRSLYEMIRQRLPPRGHTGRAT